MTIEDQLVAIARERFGMDAPTLDVQWKSELVWNVVMSTAQCRVVGSVFLEGDRVVDDNLHVEAELVCSHCGSTRAFIFNRRFGTVEFGCNDCGLRQHQ